MARSPDYKRNQFVMCTVCGNFLVNKTANFFVKLLRCFKYIKVLWLDH